MTTYNSTRTRDRKPGFIDSKISEFTPASIRGCWAWYAARLEKSYNNDDAVSLLNDWSGNEHHATQSNASVQPVYKTNQINGQPSIYFTNDNLYFGNMSLGNMSYVLVVSRTNSAGNDAILLTNGGSYAYLQYGTTWYVSSNTATIAMTGGVYYLKIATQNIITSTVSRYTNNTNHATSSFGGTVQLTHIGDPDFLFSGYIAELILYTRDIDSTDIFKLRRYLNKIYALW